jgi:hypothetical protein
MGSFGGGFKWVLIGGVWYAQACPRDEREEHVEDGQQVPASNDIIGPIVQMSTTTTPPPLGPQIWGRTF